MKNNPAVIATPHLLFHHTAQIFIIMTSVDTLCQLLGIFQHVLSYTIHTRIAKIVSTYILIAKQIKNCF